MTDIKETSSTSTPTTTSSTTAAGDDTKVNDIATGISSLLSKKDESEPDSNLRESSHEVQVTLADQQVDPNSPLFSAESFEALGLHENLLKGIYAMKYQKPSKIQEKALPLLLQNP